MIYLEMWLGIGLLTILMMAVVDWYVEGSLRGFLIDTESIYSVTTQLFIAAFVVLSGPIGFILTAIEVPSKIRQMKP